MSEKKAKFLRNNSLELIKKSEFSPNYLKDWQEDKKGRQILFSLIRHGKLPSSACPRQ